MPYPDPSSALHLFAHPFSSYCQKVLIALYENDTPFQIMNLENEGNQQTLARLWPMKRFPVLVDGEVDGGTTVLEASTIIEYLQIHHPGPSRLIPEQPERALQVRMLDRFFDNYVATPVQKIVFDCLRPQTSHDDFGVVEARQMLQTAYRWLDAHMKDKHWACAEQFSLADCAAAPFLFYADWVERIPDTLSQLQDYRRRLLARDSVKRVVDEARPYRGIFPLGAPDRD